jgi:hypothetical protein
VFDRVGHRDDHDHQCQCPRRRLQRSHCGRSRSVNEKVRLFSDITQRAGADGADHVLMYTPNPLQSGSSVSHWDTSAFPNLLMEPAINNGLTQSVEPPQDLTLELLKDTGW